MGIEPTYLAWKASVLPLNYTCVKMCIRDRTWALIGMELEEPIVNEEVRKRCLTNEIGAFDKITLLRNSAGTVSYTHLDVYKRQGI